ncbi:MAG: hypothetical protein ABIG60_02375 [Patescibacteria group bacterium]
MKQRLMQLISAEEIEQEKVFYLGGLMFFTKEHLGEADAESLRDALTMTMGANLTEETQTQGRPINIEGVINAIVGDNKEFGDLLKSNFSDMAKAYRRMKASEN